MQQKIPLLKIQESLHPEQDPRNRWQIFSAAPHRLMFFGGFAQIVLSLLWWSIELAGRYTAWWQPLPSSIFSAWIHAFLLICGTLPFFIFGFLLTTFPRWLKQAPIKRTV